MTTVVLVLAKTLSFEVVHLVNVGEALGLHYAFEWLSDMQFDNVNFETDSKTMTLSILAKMMIPNLDKLFQLVNLSSALTSQTPESSLLGDKQMRLLTHLQEKPHY